LFEYLPDYSIELENTADKTADYIHVFFATLEELKTTIRTFKPLIKMNVYRLKDRY